MKKPVETVTRKIRSDGDEGGMLVYGISSGSEYKQSTISKIGLEPVMVNQPALAFSLNCAILRKSVLTL